MATMDQLPYLTQWGMLGWCVVKDRPVIIPVELESVRTSLAIRGFVAQVTATLLYHNTSPNSLEVECVFPVDEGAAVYKFEARLDGRTIIAQCMEKKRGEKVYEEAVSGGKMAMWAREHELTPDVLLLALGNLPSDSRVEVEVSLVVELSVGRDGGVNFVLPTILNPRYCPPHPLHHTGMSFNGFSAGRLVYVPKPYTLDVKGSVCGSHHIARVISHTDPVTVTIAHDTRSAEVTQEKGFKCNHAWSLVVYYRDSHRTHVVREAGDPTGTGIMRDDLLMITIFPEVPTDSYSSKHEIIFAIDRSGSMEGEKMQSARTTLLLFLKCLPQGCLFNIVYFSSHFCLLFPQGSREYTEGSLKEARRLLEWLVADLCDVDIMPPLECIYSKPITPEYSRQILLISDGEMGKVEEVMELVGRHSHNTRVFSMGIGPRASTALIHGVARAGRGNSQVILPQDNLQQKVMSVARVMLQEAVQEVSVRCELEAPDTTTIMPSVPPTIFGGQHLVHYASLPPQATVCEVSVRGDMRGRNYVNGTVAGACVMLVHDDEMTFHRLAARAQINQWQLDPDGEDSEDVVGLSLASGVVSRSTVLVGVDQKSGPLPQINIPQLANLEKMDGSLEARSVVEKTYPDYRYTPECLSAVNLTAVDLNGQHQQEKRGTTAHLKQIKNKIKNACKRMPFGGGGGVSLEQTQESPASPVKGSGRSAASHLLWVVQLQNFDGSWCLKDAAQLCSVSLKKMTATNPPTVREAAWGTALVMVLLEKQFSADRDQWKLFSIKARDYIASSGYDLKTLIKLAHTFLNSV